MDATLINRAGKKELYTGYIITMGKLVVEEKEFKYSENGKSYTQVVNGIGVDFVQVVKTITTTTAERLTIAIGTKIRLQDGTTMTVNAVSDINNPFKAYNGLDAFEGYTITLTGGGK